MQQLALITGASSGIGKALTYQFAAHGFDCVAVAENEAELKDTALEVEAVHPDRRIVPLVRDLRRTDQCRALFDELQDRGLHVDALVNDAGIGRHGLFAESSLDEELAIIRLNIEATTILTRLFVEPMIKRNRGRILNLGSVAGFHPGPLLAVYHASKAYVVSFSEALAEELRGTGVTVTCLCPGPTDTHFFVRAGMTDTWIVKNGHLMDPDEVAEQGFRALMAGDRVHVPGVSNKVLTFIRRVVPESLQGRISKKLYEVDME